MRHVGRDPKKYKAQWRVARDRFWKMEIVGAEAWSSCHQHKAIRNKVKLLNQKAGDLRADFCLQWTDICVLAALRLRQVNGGNTDQVTIAIGKHRLLERTTISIDAFEDDNTELFRIQCLEGMSFHDGPVINNESNTDTPRNTSAAALQLSSSVEPEDMTDELKLDEQSLMEEFATTITMARSDVTSELQDLFAMIRDTARWQEVPNHMEVVTKEQLQVLSGSHRDLLKSWLCINSERLTPKLMQVRDWIEDIGDTETATILTKKLPTLDQGEERSQHIFKQLLLEAILARNAGDERKATKLRQVTSQFADTMGDNGIKMKRAAGLPLNTVGSNRAIGETGNRAGADDIGRNSNAPSDNRGPVSIDKESIEAIAEEITKRVAEELKGVVLRPAIGSSKRKHPESSTNVVERNALLDAQTQWPRSKRPRYTNGSLENNDPEWLP